MTNDTRETEDDEQSPFIENGCVICPHCGAADKITYAFDIPYYGKVVVETDDDGDSTLVAENFEAGWENQCEDRAWCLACGKYVDITDIEMQ